MICGRKAAVNTLSQEKKIPIIAMELLEDLEYSTIPQMARKQACRINRPMPEKAAQPSVNRTGDWIISSEKGAQQYAKKVFIIVNRPHSASRFPSFRSLNQRNCISQAAAT
jgi:hypothetical protein